MTNLERIKNANIEDMVDIIAKVREEGDHFFSDYYCSEICKHRNENGCLFNGEDVAPCSDVTWKDEIRAFLEAEE